MFCSLKVKSARCINYHLTSNFELMTFTCINYHLTSNFELMTFTCINYHLTRNFELMTFTLSLNTDSVLFLSLDQTLDLY